ncbi:BolA family protein [Buchnera aphidicola]|uniref:BolA family protein n=1 Tax=Buchnera aphidicola TaxID=9 RepID=UPI003BEED28A
MILKKIENSLKSNINVDFIDIFDNSASHNYSKNNLTHLTIIIISDAFININLIDRHRIIFNILKKEIKYKIYSITLYTYTIIEWKNKKNKKINFSKCLKKH